VTNDDFISISETIFIKSCNSFLISITSPPEKAISSMEPVLGIDLIKLDIAEKSNFSFDLGEQVKQQKLQEALHFRNNEIPILLYINYPSVFLLSMQFESKLSKK
jgi:hypothetical protein